MILNLRRVRDFLYPFASTKNYPTKSWRGYCMTILGGAVFLVYGCWVGVGMIPTTDGKGRDE